MAFLRSTPNSLKLWLSLFAAITVSVSLLSFIFEVHTAKSSVEHYVGIWEDDIAQAKIFQGDPSLQDKIIKQLKDVHPAVGVSEVQNPERLFCTFSTDVPITYNSLPSGVMRVCFQSADLVIRALLSPLFLMGLVLGMILIGFGFHREFKNKLSEQTLQAELSLNKEIAVMSRQVAHDIRGPLTALTTLSTLSHEMSPEKKELLELAVARIRGVAEDLLTRGKSDKSHSAKDASRDVGATNKNADLLKVVESLLKEYRFSNSKIKFELHNHVVSAKAFANLDPIKVQRILSNLLNNALEAAPENDASIHVTLMERTDQWLLQIMDNGCGIPEEILPTLTSEGVSHGKSRGHGLGLFDAKKNLQSIGGDLQIRSRVGVGTQVILLFPKNKNSAVVGL